jgi:large subunit ribosomal protein L4
MEVTKYSASGEKIGSVVLNDSIFNVSAQNNRALIYEVINMYLGNQRQGNANVKSRSDVKGTTAKMYRQKGTGNARAGSRRSPVRVGGGNAFGPRTKDWYRHIPKKKKRLALKIALTEKAQMGNVFVIESLDYEAPNTKNALQMLAKILPEKGRKLLVIDGSNVNTVKSFSNIPDCDMDRADSIYAYEVLKSKYLLLTEDALKRVEEVFNK